MAEFLYRLGAASFKRWPVVLLIWVIALGSVIGLAAQFSKPMNDAFSIPGIPSERAAELQEELFDVSQDAFTQPSVSVVVAAPEGEKLTDKANIAKVNDLIEAMYELPQMPAKPDPKAQPDPANPGLANPALAGPAQSQKMIASQVEAGTPQSQAEENAAALSPLSDDERIGVIRFAFDEESVVNVKAETRTKLIELLEEKSIDGFVAHANGNGMSNAEPPGGESELIGIGVALVVLILTFGSLVASGIPIVTAVFGLSISLTLVTASTAIWDIGTSTPILATMLGLAVGIDYALFILARYRTELRHTDDKVVAIGLAVGTAGSAVVFAGLTVLIALAALGVTGIPFLTTMGLAASVAVAVAVLVAITLLPALLGLLKGKAFAGKVRKDNPKTDAKGREINIGSRWANVVKKAPVAIVAIVIIGLGVLAIPLKDLHLAFPTDSTASSDTTQRQASDLITEGFGPGREGPFSMVIDGREITDDAERQQAFGEVVKWTREQDNVANSQIIAQNEAGTGAQVLITPVTGPDETETEDLLSAMRDGRAEIEESTGTKFGVTGLTPLTVDVSERLAGALPIYLSVVIGLAFLLLMLVFRSILVPLTATLGFLLSVLATLGATVAIFQQGMFGFLEGQPIVSFMPTFLIGVVFGLAMDYQVFLVTRVREAYVHGDDAPHAVIDGFRNSGRVVIAAALIMTSVFAAFMLQDEPIIKSMGFALAVAIILDAFVVRMTLIPALLYLMGDKAWWLPKWIDKIMPKVDVEGESLERAHLSDETEPKELVETA